MNGGVRDWGGLLAWAIIILVISFNTTKHQWFDSIGAGNKALFWSTLLGPLMAAVGWYVAANENYRKNRLLELERQERDHQGIVRQVNMLLRVVIKNLEPFFFIFTAIQLDDVIETWRRLTDLLHDRASAVALTDADFLALEAFWSRLGKMITMAQQEMVRWGTTTSTEYPQSQDERKDYLRQLFADPLPLLQRAVNTLGAPDVHQEMFNLRQDAIEFEQMMATRINRGRL